MAQNLSPSAVGVKTVPTDKLIPNPHNPRMLFDREPLKILQESIAKVGILVPMTVYRSKRKPQYIILDGQRRWICAKNLKLPKVPVNQVAAPTLVQNIVTMFQIHKFREDWELMPTALKLEILMREMKETNDRKLADLVGLDRAVVARCKKLLSFPKNYQDMMLDPNPNKRMKADFFIELYPILNDREVSRMKWYSRNKFTERMLEKYLAKGSGLKAVTDFRIMKQHITVARRANKHSEISRRLREFAEDDSVTLNHLAIESASVADSARSLLNELIKLEGAIREIDIDGCYGEEKLWMAMERINKLIVAKLREAGRRVRP